VGDALARVIAICNQKGGVGKTTTSVNLAASLAAANCETLLIDLDPQANATSSLGFLPSEVEAEIYQALCGERELSELFLETALPQLRLVPATTELVGAELELANATDRERALERCIEKVRPDFQVILIDSPPSLGILTINALTAADSVLIPLQCEYMALEGLASLQRTVELVRTSLNPKLSYEGVLLTMYDGRNNLCAQVAAEARSHLPELVFETVIPRNVRLSEAPSHGQPALLYDLSSKGALSYLELANELLTRIQPNGNT